jgi:hypothetical protein
MKYLILLLFLCATAQAQDDQYIIDGGIGVSHSADHGLSETKMLTLGVQEDLFGPLKDRAVVGGWLDNAGNGRNSSALASGQIGFEVNRNGFVAGAFTGPCVISSPDVLLGGNLQFMDDLHLGIQDNQNNYFGIMYRHLSSAGLEQPNTGRDIIGIELRF